MMFGCGADTLVRIHDDEDRPTAQVIVLAAAFSLTHVSVA